MTKGESGISDKGMLMHGFIAKDVMNGKPDSVEQLGGWTDYVINGVKVGSWKTFGRTNDETQQNGEPFTAMPK